MNEQYEPAAFAVRPPWWRRLLWRIRGPWVANQYIHRQAGWNTTFWQKGGWGPRRYMLSRHIEKDRPGGVGLDVGRLTCLWGLLTGKLGFEIEFEYEEGNEK